MNSHFKAFKRRRLLSYPFYIKISEKHQVQEIWTERNCLIVPKEMASSRSSVHCLPFRNSMHHWFIRPSSHIYTRTYISIYIIFLCTDINGSQTQLASKHSFGSCCKAHSAKLSKYFTDTKHLWINFNYLLFQSEVIEISISYEEYARVCVCMSYVMLCT